MTFLYEDPRLNHEARSLFCSAVYLRPKSLSDLTKKTGLGRRKVVLICRELAKYGWLRLVGKGQTLRPVCWVPREYQTRLVRELGDDCAMTPFQGEFLFGRVLEFLVDVPRFIHNARPEFLKHPKTGEPLELDFYAPGILGGEFNGPQHYAETRKYSDKQAVADTKARDLVKEALCVRFGIPLIVVTAETLSIESVMSLLPANIPLHDVDLGEPYARRLSQLCAMYRRNAPRIPQASAVNTN